MPEAPAPFGVSAPASRIALIGNPNVGKTSLFNQLTGLRQRVGNYPGVTVERREGKLRGTEQFILDLPGVNSLVPRAPDEDVAVRVLLGDMEGTVQPDAVVVVLDAARPRRGLFLLSQVFELGIPTLVCLNMVDEARAQGSFLDRAVLESRLGVPVVETVATHQDGISELLRHLQSGAGFARPPSESCVHIPGIQGLPDPASARWRRLREVVKDADLSDRETEARYGWAARQLVGLQGAAPASSPESPLDRFLLHPVAGPLIFVAVMGTLFQAVFGLAQIPADAIESGFSSLAEAVRGLVPDGLLQSFLAEGLVGGVGGVLVFLPQVLILFFFIGVLEDTGYMTRAAFLVDRPLRAVGLSGRSFIPLLSSFACAVPGILATRSLEDRRERFLATFVAPLMTCSARLPVYAIMIGAFVPERAVVGPIGLQGLVLLGLYLLGIVLAAAAAWVIDRFLRRAGRVPGVLEMPPYRWPSARTIAARLYQRGVQFLQRAGTVILVMSIAVWVLITFPRVEGVDDGAAGAARQISGSFAGQLGRALEPAIAPLGFDWRIGVGLVGSLAAREVFVSTMAVVYSVEDGGEEASADGSLVAAFQGARWPDGRRVFDGPTVAALLVFFAIALQCVSTIAVVYRETGSGLWAGSQFVAFTLLAWVGAYVARGLVS